MNKKHIMQYEVKGIFNLTDAVGSMHFYYFFLFSAEFRSYNVGPIVPVVIKKSRKNDVKFHDGTAFLPLLS
ncbi:MAG: hypothetical protein A2Y62_08420 [Candidatus Fischerbacteria bacterium RBG_13_37_8]|uniref:Uncharacterized protein n=1 Tax=Candidatus Fischerbacteria bacterium RBG_13_37_8 TaxID=1817863 RepID=A0A1F5VLN0_9BACT|nr:MAG: hypothetical protein A2Y62_08420 [Candidatus Fischerbacteria bacterium RBG_13_37_8]